MHEHDKHMKIMYIITEIVIHTQKFTQIHYTYTGFPAICK